MSFKERFKENKKIYIIRILTTLLTISWMVLIFFFSHEGGSESSNTSGRFVNLFIKIFIPSYDSLDGSTQEQIFSSVSLVIRKLAHFSIFGVLGLLIFFMLGSYKVRKFIYVYSSLGACLYACLDEIHQMYVPGRAGVITDVLIDTSGAITFLLITFLIIKLVRHIKNKKNISNSNI